MTWRPSVTVVVPVLDEAAALGATLAAVGRQTYGSVVEVLVVDGGSTDATVSIARATAGVRVVDNPRRIQASAMNLGLEQARGEIIVRLDGHCLPADDYVARCVEALDESGAAMVGGSMRPIASGFPAAGIAAAMASRLGAGTALFHRIGAQGWVDTVWLGAFRRDDAVAVDGYDESLPVNEDADFARRISARGGIWLDRRIVCHYRPRSTYRGLARQFVRYGRGRATTVRAAPSRIAPRQLAAPLLVLALLSPARRGVATAYAVLVIARGWSEAGALSRRVAFVAALPVMHVSWGVGFLAGLLRPLRRRL